VTRSKERIQHGKPIGKHQLIQRHIAEIRQNLEMARWPTYFAAITKDEYEKDITDKRRIREADNRISIAKKIASRLAFESADRAVQIFGGFGYSLLSPVGALFLDSRVTRIYEGTDEIQELKIASYALGEGFEAFR
jgi:alkylation response protein AidB-like acyl-CoA dehydrogenase